MWVFTCPSDTVNMFLTCANPTTQMSPTRNVKLSTVLNRDGLRHKAVDYTTIASNHPLASIVNPRGSQPYRRLVPLLAIFISRYFSFFLRLRVVLLMRLQLTVLTAMARRELTLLLSQSVTFGFSSSIQGLGRNNEDVNDT